MLRVDGETGLFLAFMRPMLGTLVLAHHAVYSRRAGLTARTYTYLPSPREETLAAVHGHLFIPDVLTKAWGRTCWTKPRSC